MDLQALDYEEEIVRSIKDGAPVSLEKALLVVSGLKTDKEIRSCQTKIDLIYGRFLGKCGDMSLSGRSTPPAYLHPSIAKALFEYLWTSKPKRFGESFLLTDVVDAQLDPDVHRPVGTCVGLTSLYSVLALRAGLDLFVLSGLDHLRTGLRVGRRTIDIDHTDPQGFDCPKLEEFREFPMLTLTANVLNSRGLRSELIGDHAAAGADYRKAVLINPQYASAFNNRANMKFRGGDVEGAIGDYTEAIRLAPGFCEAYCNRAMAGQRLGRYDDARRDYNTAIALEPEYKDARKCLRLLNEILS